MKKRIIHLLILVLIISLTQPLKIKMLNNTLYNPTLNSLIYLHLHFYSLRLRIHLVFNNTRIIRYNKQTNQFNWMLQRIKLPLLKINLILIHHIIIRNRHNLIRRKFLIMVGVLRITQAQAFKATKLINIPILNKILKNM